MAYKLYTDKQETFECDLFLEGADLKQSSARILVETKDLTLLFPGKINEDGNCKVPIKKLKGLLDENSKGNIKLEVIAEDVYFNPWESDFEVVTDKKIKVEVKQQDKPIIENKKPKMVVKEIKNNFNPVDNIVNILDKQNINIVSLHKKRKTIVPILKEYSKKSGYKNGTKKFINEVIKKLKNK